MNGSNLKMLESLVELLRCHGGRWRRGVSGQQLGRLERRMDAPLPQALRQLLLFHNGMKRPCKDLAWIRFWSINEFEPVDPGNTRIKIKQHEVKWVRARFLIRFCDALVECPVYALNLDPDDAMNGEVLECGDFTQVAGSIEGFIEMVTSMNEASLPPL